MFFFKSNIDVGNFKYQSYLPLKMSFQSVDVKSYTGFKYFYIVSFLFLCLKTTGFFSLKTLSVHNYCCKIYKEIKMVWPNYIRLTCATVKYCHTEQRPYII